VLGVQGSWRLIPHNLKLRQKILKQTGERRQFGAGAPDPIEAYVKEKLAGVDGSRKNPGREHPRVFNGFVQRDEVIGQVAIDGCARLPVVHVCSNSTHHHRAVNLVAGRARVDDAYSVDR
jgi:hypothetical protein